MTFATKRPLGVAAAFMLTAAASSLPATAQIASPDFEMFALRMEDGLRSRHEAAPQDALAEIAVKTIDTFPVIFQVVAERAYEARQSDPSIALDPNWTSRYLSDIPRTVLAFHGNRIAQSPLPALDAFHAAQVSYLEFLAGSNEELCAAETATALATVSADRFRSVTQADDEAVSQFSRLNSAVSVEAIRAIFAAAESPQQGSVGEPELDALTTALVEAGFADEEVAGILEGQIPGADAGERCEAGLRFQKALSGVGDATRRDILAVYLTPPARDSSSGNATGEAAPELRR